MLAMASTSRQSNNIVEKTSTPTFALASSPSHPKGLYHEDLQKAIPTVAVAFKTQKCGGSNSLQRCELNLLLQQQQNKHTDLLVTERAMLLQHPFPYDQHQQRWMHIQQMALAAMPQPQALQPSINRASAA